MKEVEWTTYTVMRLSRWMLVLLLSTAASMLWAHGGEEHSHDEPQTELPMMPGVIGFEIASAEVEMVGRFSQGNMTLYVDDYATNTPVAGLSIEITADANSAKAEEIAPGEYRAALPWVQSPGHYPLVFVLESAALTDLLQATLDATVQTASAEAAAQTGAVWMTQRWGWGVAGGVAVAVLLMLLVGRHRATAVSVLLLTGAITGAPDVQAHGGEDHRHDEAPAVTFTGDSPRRLPDGRVFIPKATQRLLAIRTLVAASEAGHRSVALNGRVIADPAASGVVQAGQAGRIEAGPDGFPVLGQRVKAGQVLAWLMPLTSSLERGNQQAALAEINAQLAVAERKQARLESLQGSVPQKDIEAARLEAEGMRQRREALTHSLYQKEPLKAPVAGVISTSEAVAGQVVSEGALLFTVLQSDRLWVEALAYDPALALSDDRAVAQAGSLTVTLTRLGTGAVLRDQSIPLHFRIESPVPPLPVGQPVTVLVKTQTLLQGIPVPVDALARNAEGQWVVWLHEKAEIFRPVGVHSEPLDGDRVMITRGLQAGARVVSAGAASLGQIR